MLLCIFSTIKSTCNSVCPRHVTGPQRPGPHWPPDTKRMLSYTALLWLLQSTIRRADPAGRDTCSPGLRPAAWACSGTCSCLFPSSGPVSSARKGPSPPRSHAASLWGCPVCGPPQSPLGLPPNRKALLPSLQTHSC